MKPILYVFAAILAAGSLPASAQAPSPGEIRAIAGRAYIFAYPMVLMEYTRRNAVGPNGAGANRLAHAQTFPSAGTANVIRPNADTLYSSSWIDLTEEPVLLHVPDTHGRYYLMQFMDAWTETFSVPGKRTTGTDDGWFAIVGPGWKGHHLPDGAQRIDAPTNMVWLIGRTQTNGPSDYENVHAIQRGYRLMPLSKYPDGVPPVANGVTRRVASAEMTPPRQVERLSPMEFFTTFASLLADNPPHPDDGPMMKDLARIGIVPGQPFDLGAFDAAAKQALEEGAQAASKSLNGGGGGARRVPRAGANGWSGGLGEGTTAVGRYGTNYASRAAVARGGLGANPPEDAIYMNCAQDTSGAALDGTHTYRLHFDKDKMPPVRAFWSITMYGPDGFFIANPISRFAIGDRDQLKFNADGSLDLYVSQNSPGAGKESNWLPSPAGAFNLTFRMYWPEEQALSGKWIPPAVSPFK